MPWILYPVPLPNSFISSNSFFVESLRFSLHSIMPSVQWKVYFLLTNSDASDSFPLSDCRGFQFGQLLTWSSL